ncbi:unnamed protein product [Linum tenue]|uniref:Peptidase C1A papain C-terminal domain-containing protein n=1 Tax=Linum tenue TaxID=586396 RepID=A0AAV0QV78_9ROSI|nr:unnamed protein product [Linum tenue]
MAGGKSKKSKRVEPASRKISRGKSKEKEIEEPVDPGEDFIEFDWRPLGIVRKEIQDQGDYPVCWAVSIALATEAMLNLTEEKPRWKASAQEIIDWKLTDEEKIGKKMPTRISIGWDYILDNGLSKEDNYGFTQMPNLDKDRPMQGILVNGIYRGPTDRKENPKFDHVMLLVGHGYRELETGQKIYYFICRNSYGPDWGVKGHVKILRLVSFPREMEHKPSFIRLYTYPKPRLPVSEKESTSNPKEEKVIDWGKKGKAMMHIVDKGQSSSSSQVN